MKYVDHNIGVYGNGIQIRPLNSALEHKTYFLSIFLVMINTVAVKGKGKAVPLQTWSGPDSSRKLRFPDYMTTAQDGGKFVSLTHRPPLPPGITSGTHLC